MEPVKNCRCGSIPTKPKECTPGSDRWVIKCTCSQCRAVNYGIGLTQTVSGWNRMSTGFYR